MQHVSKSDSRFGLFACCEGRYIVFHERILGTRTNEMKYRVESASNTASSFPLMPARSPKCKPMIETKQKAEIELPKIRGTENSCACAIAQNEASASTPIAPKNT